MTTPETLAIEPPVPAQDGTTKNLELGVGSSGPLALPEASEEHPGAVGYLTYVGQVTASFNLLGGEVEPGQKIAMYDLDTARRLMATGLFR